MSLAGWCQPRYSHCQWAAGVTLALAVAQCHGALALAVPVSVGASAIMALPVLVPLARGPGTPSQLEAALPAASGSATGTGTGAWAQMGFFARQKRGMVEKPPDLRDYGGNQARQGTSSYANLNIAWLVTFQFPIKVARRLK